MTAHEVATQEKLAAIVQEARTALESGTGVTLRYFFRSVAQSGRKGAWTETSATVDVLETASVPQTQLALLVKDSEGDEAVCAFPTEKATNTAMLTSTCCPTQKTTKKKTRATQQQNDAQSQKAQTAHSTKQPSTKTKSELHRQHRHGATGAVAPTTIRH